MVKLILFILALSVICSSCQYLIPGFEEALEETEIKVSIDKEAEKK